MQDITNKTIGVFFGGQSPEHEISVITGEFVIAELQKKGMKVVPVYVGKKGNWYSSDEIGKLSFFKGDYEATLAKQTEYFLDIPASQKKLVLKEQKAFGAKSITIDFAFPTFHGMYGEDGTVQGMFEFFRVPYAGCGLYTSSIAIDKGITKGHMMMLGVPTTKAVWLLKESYTYEAALEQIKSQLGMPIFVKPARAGSSIGISKVKNYEQLEDALNLAFHYDSRVIVEDSVENIVDLTCAALRLNGTVIASEIQESKFASDLFDFSGKYLEDGGAQTGNATSSLVIPASVNPEITMEVKRITKMLFQRFDANGTMRVDFLYNKETGVLYANEINTLPGTLYHHLWDKSGVSISEVLDAMITDGMNRWNLTDRMAVSFKTDVLNAANSMKLQHKKD